MPGLGTFTAALAPSPGCRSKTVHGHAPALRLRGCRCSATSSHRPFAGWYQRINLPLEGPARYTHACYQGEVFA